MGALETALLIISGLFILSLASATLIAAKHASKKEYLCKKCGKRFFPRKRDALGAAYSFGHKSVLVRCPHCKNKERLLPVDHPNPHKHD